MERYIVEFRGAVIFRDTNVFENCHLKVTSRNSSNQFVSVDLISLRDFKLNFLLMVRSLKLLCCSPSAVAFEENDKKIISQKR